MLFFFFSSRRRHTRYIGDWSSDVCSSDLVDRYFDAATGVMAKDAQGKLAMTEVTLKPQVTFSGERLPTREQIDSMHHEAHDECFIANSVKRSEERRVGKECRSRGSHEY